MFIRGYGDHKVRRSVGIVIIRLSGTPTRAQRAFLCARGKGLLMHENIIQGLVTRKMWCPNADVHYRLTVNLLLTLSSSSELVLNKARASAVTPTSPIRLSVTLAKIKGKRRMFEANTVVLIIRSTNSLL